MVKVGHNLTKLHDYTCNLFLQRNLMERIVHQMWSVLL